MEHFDQGSDLQSENTPRTVCRAQLDCVNCRVQHRALTEFNVSYWSVKREQAVQCKLTDRKEENKESDDYDQQRN